MSKIVTSPFKRKLFPFKILRTSCLINMKYIHELKILDHEASANLGTDWRDRHPYDLGVVE